MKPSNQRQDIRGQTRIGDVAKQLNVEKFVIRFWEKEFGLKSRRSSGGQRYYTRQDIERIRLIKKLLHEEGMTIAGARNRLNSNEHQANGKHAEKEVIAATKLTVPTQDRPQISVHAASISRDQLLRLRDQLIALRKMLP